MAGADKGFMTGGMTFGTGDDPTAPAERDTLLPLRLLVVADLIPRDPHNAGASAPEAPLRVDAARFDELFQKLRPRIAVEVPSVLAEGRNVRVDVAPTSMKSFRPDGLCAELPLLRSLLDGRLVLERLRDGALTPDRARAELERLWGGSPFAREVLGLLPAPSADAPPTAAAPPPAAAPPGHEVAAFTSGPESASGGALASILSLVDVGGSPSPAPAPAAAPAPAPIAQRSKFSDLIASVAKSGKPTGRPVDPSEAIARVEKALGAQIGIILQHPEVRRLESAWRGLRFLVDRAQSHSGIRIDVVSARPDDTAKALGRAVKSVASGEPPVTCAIADVDVDGTARSFLLLEEVAAVAEAAGVPTIVNAAPSLLGREDLGEIEKLDNKMALFEAPERAPWRSTAARPAMTWVAAVANPVLARAPYDKGTSRVREAVIQELPADEGAFVWINPVWVAGALVLASFRATGWPCRIVGPRDGGVCENLPVREVKSSYAGEEGTAIPTLAFLSTDTQKELARMGIIALACAPNSDATIVMHAPTFYVPPPKRTYDSATTEPEARLERVSLVDQLFAARIAQFLRALCSKLPPSSDPAEVGPVVKAAVWELFDKAPPGMEIDAVASRGSDGTSVRVTVRPRRFLGVSLEEIGLEVPLG